MNTDLRESSAADRPVAAFCGKDGLDPVLREAMTAEIAALGWRVRVVRDGDPAGLEADVLLMFGYSRSFRQYPHRLRGADQQRPRTILWQVDPLLPPNMTAAGRQSALRAAGIYDRLDWIGRSGLGNGSPSRRLAIQRAIYRFISKPRYLLAASRGFPSDVKRDWERIHYRTIRIAAECEQWIIRAVREGWLDQVCVSTVQKQRYLAEHGIASTFAPVGVYPALGRDLHLDRDIDLLFIGTVRPGQRRERLLRRLEEQLRKQNVNLRVITGGCHGEARTELLNRTKLLLHLHQYPWDTPWIRLFMATACGAALLSEPMIDARPFQPGAHYVEAEADRLAEAAAGLIKDAPRLERIVAAAQQCIRREHTLGRSLGKILAPCRATVAGQRTEGACL